jgi:hypothetical protein
MATVLSATWYVIEERCYPHTKIRSVFLYHDKFLATLIVITIREDTPAGHSQPFYSILHDEISARDVALLSSEPSAY